MEGPPSDETLLAGVAERDIGALHALYERHARDSVEHVEHSLEDAYLLLRGGSPEHEPAGEVAS